MSGSKAQKQKFAEAYANRQKLDSQKLNEELEPLLKDLPELSLKNSTQTGAKPKKKKSPSQLKKNKLRQQQYLEKKKNQPQQIAQHKCMDLQHIELSEIQKLTENLTMMETCCKMKLIEKLLKHILSSAQCIGISFRLMAPILQDMHEEDLSAKDLEDFSEFRKRNKDIDTELEASMTL